MHLPQPWSERRQEQIQLSWQIYVLLHKWIRRRGSETNLGPEKDPKQRTTRMELQRNELYIFLLSPEKVPGRLEDESMDVFTHSHIVFTTSQILNKFLSTSITETSPPVPTDPFFSSSFRKWEHWKLKTKYTGVCVCGGVWVCGCGWGWVFYLFSIETFFLHLFFFPSRKREWRTGDRNCNIPVVVKGTWRFRDGSTSRRTRSGNHTTSPGQTRLMSRGKDLYLGIQANHYVGNSLGKGYKLVKDTENPCYNKPKQKKKK